ncbi:MAG: MBL fold metallo-hydrolase [Verrucomicrobia bacterium]|nr:MBL fold metallo-hydrolase [Verrucomicrobiota bacterium]
MATITLLGTAPGYPAAYRNHSSFLLDTGEHKILVDAGESCSRTLIELGIEPVELDTIIITHGHSDHTGGLAMLIQSCWIVGRKRPLPIFLPKELIQPLTIWLDASYIGPNFIPFELQFQAWEDSHRVNICGINVRVAPTTHLDSLVKKFGNDRFHPFSLSFDAPDFEFVASADIGAPEDLLSQLENGTDLLICELAHFPPKSLFRFLQKFRISRLVLTHCSAEVLAKVDSVVAEARAMLPKTEIIFAEDKMKVQLAARK